MLNKPEWPAYITFNAAPDPANVGVFTFTLETRNTDHAGIYDIKVHSILPITVNPV